MTHQHISDPSGEGLGTVQTTKGGEVAIATVGELGIVFNCCAVPDATFQEFCELESASVALRGPHGALLSVVLSDGPTAEQRRLLESYNDRFGISKMRRMAVMTDSLLAGAALALYSLASRRQQAQNRAFRMADCKTALWWLREVASFQTPDAIAMLATIAHVCHQQQALARLKLT